MWLGDGHVCALPLVPSFRSSGSGLFLSKPGRGWMIPAPRAQQNEAGGFAAGPWDGYRFLTLSSQAPALGTQLRHVRKPRLAQVERPHAKGPRPRPSASISLSDGRATEALGCTSALDRPPGLPAEAQISSSRQAVPCPVPISKPQSPRAKCEGSLSHSPGNWNRE